MGAVPGAQSARRTCIPTSTERPFVTKHVSFFLTMLVASLCLSQSALQAVELPRAAPADVGMRADRLDAITARLRSDVQANQLPGAVVLVARQGRIAYLESFGTLDTVSGKPMTEDTIFRIYSMTKPIAVVAALTLVDAGKIKLDDPVATHLPAMKDMQVTGSGAPALRAMTVRDLMRHTSGLDYPYVAPNSERTRLLNEARRKLSRDPSIAELTDMLVQIPLAAEPGTVWNYGNGMDVLGRLVEVVSGMSFGAYMAQQVFAPLDMRDTAFFFTDPDRQARMAEPIPDDLLFGTPMFNPRLPRRGEFGGDGLLSTARDYARFLQMLLNGGVLDGKRVLRAETVAEMTRDQLVGIAQGPAYSPGALYTFGLGFAVRHAGPEVEPAGELGDYAWAGAGGTYFWGDPKNQMLVVVMLQSTRLRAYRSMLRKMVYDATLR